jgi:predicted Rossmann-fold nucleotide-binding protein
MFEALTLVQTRRVTSFPIVLMGRDYWGGLVGWLRSTALPRGTINPSDLDLLHVTDDVGDAVRHVIRWDDQVDAQELREAHDPE